MTPLERAAQIFAAWTIPDDEAGPHLVVDNTTPWNGAVWNDAVVVGPACTEFDDVMARSARFMVGRQYVSADAPRRGTKNDGWQWFEQPFSDWVAGTRVTRIAPVVGFSLHPVSDRKDGACIVLGANDESGHRLKHTMVSMDAIGLDIDKGGDIESVKEKVRVSGLAAFLYTTHSHLKTRDWVLRDAVVRFAKCSGDPTDAELQAYLTEIKGEDPLWAKQCSILRFGKSDKGRETVEFSTPPQHKMRLIFPLAQRVNLQNLANTEADRLVVWAEKVLGLAAKLNLRTDNACLDPSRLFFAPAHAENREYEAIIFRGRPVVFEQIDRVSKATYSDVDTSNPFLVASADLRQQEHVTVDNLDVTALYKRYGKRWDLVRIIEETFTEEISRNARGERVETLCPFHEHHSDPEHYYAVAFTPDGMDEGAASFASWPCVGDYCKSRNHSLAHMLAQSIKNGWLDPAVLEDPAYMIPMPDDWVEAPYQMLTPREVQVKEEVCKEASLTAEQRAGEFGLTSRESDIRAFIKDLVEAEVDTVTKANVAAIIAKNTNLTKIDVKRFFKDFEQGVNVPRVPTKSDRIKVDTKLYEDPADWLPAGFFVKDGLIGYDADFGPVELCQLFNVVGRASDLTGREDAARLIEFMNLNGERVELMLDRGELFREGGGTTIDALARSEMVMWIDDRSSRDALLRLLRNIRTSRLVKIVPAPGWTRDAYGDIVGFLTPAGELITNDAKERKRLSPLTTIKDVERRGTLEEWRRAVRAAEDHVEGNFYWLFGVAAGFTGPILDALNEPPCGVYLSGRSSLGKTIGLTLAASVWGSTAASHGLFHAMNSTSNALEDLAGMGTSAVLALDEIGAMQRPQDLASVLFGMSTGAGKSRKAGRGAGLAKTQSFRPFVLLSSEHSMKVVIERAGGSYIPGLSVRFPDVDVSGGARVSADVLQDLGLVKTNHGHAGSAFVRHLLDEGIVDDVEALKARRNKIAEELAGEAAAPAISRASTVFANVALAAELAADAGLIDKARSRLAVEIAFSRFTDTDEARGVGGDEGILDAFRSWLNSGMGLTIIDVADADAPVRVPVGWFDDHLIYLDAVQIKDPKVLKLNGKLEDLLRALNGIGAIDKKGAKNNYHTHLPMTVAGGRAKAVKHIRIKRADIGI